MKRNRPAGEKLTKVFGLIARSEASLALVVSHSLIPVAEIMPSVVEGVDEQEFFVRHPGIRPEEIRAIKAYHARFGSDPENPAPLPEGPKALLLDENIPYTLLPYVTQHFGFSSHVEAEGFSRQNRTALQRGPVAALDGRIARFAVDNQFAGLVTHDTDFAALYKYPTHPVRSIRVFLLEKRDDGLADAQRLARSRDTIQRALEHPVPQLVTI